MIKEVDAQELFKYNATPDCEAASVFENPAILTQEARGAWIGYSVAFGDRPLNAAEVWAVLRSASPQPDFGTPARVIKQWQLPDQTSFEARARIERHRFNLGHAWRTFLEHRLAFISMLESYAADQHDDRPVAVAEIKWRRFGSSAVRQFCLDDTEQCGPNGERLLSSGLFGQILAAATDQEMVKSWPPSHDGRPLGPGEIPVYVRIQDWDVSQVSLLSRVEHILQG